MIKRERSACTLVSKDKRGQVDTFHLGADLDQAAQDVTWDILDKLESVVNTQLVQEYLHQSKREQLTSSIYAEAAAVLEQVKNPLNARYKASLEAAKKAEEILNQRQEV